MAGAGGVALAQAVQLAGALGSLPSAMLTHSALETQLKTLNDASLGPLNVNFFTHASKPDSIKSQRQWQASLTEDYKRWGLDPDDHATSAARLPFNESLCELIEATPPNVVSFHFGLPDEALLQRVKSAGCQVWSSATTVAEARWLDERGADAIIAQGFEAGGHRGLFLDPETGAAITEDKISLIAHQVGTLALVPQIVDAVSVPVIAAGGIADGRGMAAALALGASAVQIGTAFLLTAEATISALHRNALQSSDAELTALTNVFSGKPARGVMNDVMRKHGPMNEHVPVFPTAGAALAPLKAAAEASSDASFSSLWSGQSARLAAQLIQRNLTNDQIPSATELVQWIAQDARRVTAQLPAI